MSAAPFGTTVPGNRWDLVAATDAPARTVSVVVAHYEQPAQLARTLHALGRQTLPPHEVVVADDGSATPPSVPDGVRVVRQEDRGFRAAAVRNLGARATTGEVLVFLDADTTPEPGYLDDLSALPSLLPELLATGHRLHADLAGVPADAPVEDAAPARALPEPAWLREAHRDSDDLLRADAAAHRFAIGAVLACTRWWFDEIGGFDESFAIYGGEDWDLAHRSWLAGGLLAHRPAARAWHDGPDAGVEARDDDGGLAETVAVADRMSGPVTGWRGLLRGPAPLVVTADPGLADAELLVTLDGLLAALPRTMLLLAPHHRRLAAGDPRVGPDGGTLPPGARLHLHLRRGLLGGPDDWQHLATSLDGPEGWAVREVGPGWAVLRDLRLARRAERWGRDDLLEPHPEPAPGLRPWDGQRLAAALGGWA